jgi:uridine kinase
MSNPGQPLVVGIAGGTGSGKTVVATNLAKRYAQIGVLILDQDSYYRDQRHLSEAERTLVNYDEPQVVDHDLLFHHLQQLIAGQPIEKPRYRFATHTRDPEWEVVHPRPIIFVEGLFALWYSPLRSLMDLKVYVEADPDMRFIRRLRRDVLERGRTVESVIAQYLKTVRPMHLAHIEPTKAYADVVVDNTESLEQAVTLIDRAIAKRCPSCATGRG